MRKWKQKLRGVTAILVCLTPTVAFAWNPKGHRVIASIAYRQLDDQTRRKIAEVLKNHPAYAELWANRPTNGPDKILNLLWNASIFPDDARRPPWDRFHHPKAHYVNYRIMGDQGNKIEPPLPDENVIDSYIDHLRQIKDPGTPVEERALHLSWILHQASDIHQPLHAVARFSRALPEGDRGGNEVHVPNPRGLGERSNNMHAYWDNLLGTDEDPAAIDRLADELIKEQPLASFADDLKKTGIRDWALKSAQVCLTTVYDNLDPEITNVVSLPTGYEEAARKMARKRVTLAGYRLADELKRLFGEPR